MQTLEMEKIYHVHNNGKYLGKFKTHLPIQKDTNEVVGVQIYEYFFSIDVFNGCYFYNCGVVIEFHNIDNDDVLYLTHENKKQNKTFLLKFSRKNSDKHVIVYYTLSGDNLYIKRNRSFYNEYQNEMEKQYSLLKSECCYPKEKLGKTCIHLNYHDYLLLNVGDIIFCKFHDFIIDERVPLLITNIDKDNQVICINLYDQSILKFRIFNISLQKEITKLLCEIQLRFGCYSFFSLPPNITKLT